MLSIINLLDAVLWCLFGSTLCYLTEAFLSLFESGYPTPPTYFTEEGASLANANGRTA